MSTKDKSIKIPTPNRYVLRYRRNDGIIKTYDCTPIEILDDRFTAYVYGEGVRTFKNIGVLDIKRIKVIG